MISFLKGILNNVSDSGIIIQSGDIGFFVSYRGQRSLLLGEEISVYTYMSVRENDISLWGFDTFEELEVFKLLINISGVGPKTAQVLLTELSMSTLINAIEMGDYSKIKAPGVGSKTAQKITIELRDKVSRFNVKRDVDIVQKLSRAENDKRDEVINAMISLGYREIDIIKAVDSVLQEVEDQVSINVQDLIKKVLRKI
jgi:Holliday junction DNA helicase RuvA